MKAINAKVVQAVAAELAATNVAYVSSFQWSWNMVKRYVRLEESVPMQNIIFMIRNKMIILS